MKNYDVKVGQVRVLRPQSDGNYIIHWNHPMKIERIENEYQGEALVVARDLINSKHTVLYTSRFMVE